MKSRGLHRTPSELSRGIILLGLMSMGCAALNSNPPVESEGSDVVVARVDDREISTAELDDWIKEQLFQREVGGNSPAQAYTVRREHLDFLIQDAVANSEAERLGVDVEEVVRSIVEELGPVTDIEVRGYYVQNRQNLPQDQPFEVLAPRIREFLEMQKLQQAGEVLIQRANVRILIEPPRATVAQTGPSLGVADAPVTIVEFSDFQCPYCSRAAPVVKSLVDRYPEQVRLVYRHMPLDFHAQARDAARASVCADDQGRFWDYHDALFANQQKLHVAELERYAGEIGLDVAALTSCMADPETTAVIDADARAAREVGVNGTPAFFINGILISGARPIEDFIEVIESELERLADATDS